MVVPIKDKKRTSIANAFKKILNDSNRKPNKKKDVIKVVNSIIDLLKKNNTETYSTYNEGKFVVAERFIRTLKSKIFKHIRASC